ncbi:UDP-N-acetylmuramoyl-tripeptide--D-alanyl-D-alanine ligase [Acetobacteraceae bacterium KSS8]|uniref:UDP-N-acetylmuramoyl-tripeptide--D-alanyl-D-alanine ligase n=1 Tax=Endosaccharibacter trunci TaxID=2812733 RepID=A0ABT1W2V4_9PROT|nr:UDP-N-acetylmuramoyl-tripeptide--D-alanyl-D-alanine ligase [Acetobacteraceae bacterium KSS8]
MSAFLWTGAALADAVSGRFAKGVPDGITGISIDTRTLRPGELFVALVGENGDGHAHVAKALEKGAAAALVHRMPDGLAPDAPLLLVEDSFAALHRLGRAGRDRFGGRVVAVTGSVGKTTTKEMLRVALGAIGPTSAAQASFNNHWGVPLTLARMPVDAAFAVIEIGMNHPGEIAPLAALARPHAAIISTVAATHIGHMGSLLAIAEEKAAIFGALEPGGTAIFPAAAPHADRLQARAEQRGARIVRTGMEALLEDCVLRADGTDAVATLGDLRLALHLQAPGRHLADNALSCLAAVRAVGADPAIAAAALAGFAPGDGRGALKPILGGGVMLLDESYNASGASMRASLAVLKLLPAKRRVAVLGDMLELGEFARREHEDLNPCVRESADIVYCSGPMTKFLYETLPGPIRGAHAADAASLAPIVRAALQEGDVVLVKGSFGSRMRDVVSALTAPAATTLAPVIPANAT